MQTMPGVGRYCNFGLLGSLPITFAQGAGFCSMARSCASTAFDRWQGEVGAHHEDGSKGCQAIADHRCNVRHQFHSNVGSVVPNLG